MNGWMKQRAGRSSGWCSPTRGSARFGTTLGTLAGCRRSGLLPRINPTAWNGVFAEGRDGECVVWSDRYQDTVFNVPLLPALWPHHAAVELHEEMCSGRRRRFGVEEKALHTAAALQLGASIRRGTIRKRFPAEPICGAAPWLRFARAFRIVAGAELRRGRARRSRSRVSVFRDSPATPATATGENEPRDRQRQATPNHLRQPMFRGHGAAGFKTNIVLYTLRPHPRRVRHGALSDGDCGLGPFGDLLRSRVESDTTRPRTSGGFVRGDDRNRTGVDGFAERLRLRYLPYLSGFQGRSALSDHPENHSVWESFGRAGLRRRGRRHGGSACRWFSCSAWLIASSVKQRPGPQCPERA